MSANNPFARLPEAASFTVTSTAVRDGDAWQPAQWSSGAPGGKDLSPQLSWSGSPTGTKSYAVTVHALDVDDIGVAADATPALLGFTITGHILGRATLVATAETVQ